MTFQAREPERKTADGRPAKGLEEDLAGPVRSSVRVTRDGMGIPHVMTSNRLDAYLGLGYAMGEDRLWQMDWYRRSAQGRTAEIRGAAYLAQDIEARHIGFAGLAEAALAGLPAETADILGAFCNGVNLALEQQRRDLPPEFKVLGYAPEPWSPVDSLAVLRAFWWQLSGRLYWMAAHDFILRTLPASLADAFLMPSWDVGSIIDPDASVDNPNTSGADDGSGSNNWVVSGRLSTTGAPLLASDPHVGLFAPSVWYEAHLECPEESSAGICYAGVPGFLIGRNRRIAWGFTNNICSIRDLYRERLNPADPNQYLESGDRWRSFDSRDETIAVRDAESATVRVLATVRGTIVNALIDERVRPEQPVSLAWTGTQPGDEIGVMLRYQTARSLDEFKAALGDWVCPTFNFVFTDETAIGYQCAGVLPHRGRRWLGVRDADREDDAWQLLRQTPSLPSSVEPGRGWIASANNRVATTDAVISQSGYWPSSLRAERIRQLLESGVPHDAGSMQQMQRDVHSLRAERVVPALLQHLDGESLSPIARLAASTLGSWDGAFSLEAAGATVFETFMLRWVERVAEQRFPPHVRELVVPHGHGYAGHLLVTGDDHAWFGQKPVAKCAQSVFEQVVAELAGHLGPQPAEWLWGRVHRVALRHPLDSETATVWPFRMDPEPLDGGWQTINNEFYDLREPFLVNVGVSHRVIADLAVPDAVLSASSSGASGDPRSPHYRDGFDEWRRGGFHPLWLSQEDLDAQATHVTNLRPGPGQ